MYKCSVSLQCCQCRKYIYANLFESHINFCISKAEYPKEDGNLDVTFENKSFDVQVIEAKVVSNDTEKAYIQYLINVKSLGENKSMWQICRRFKHINQLQKRLEEIFENDLPCSAMIMKQ